MDFEKYLKSGALEVDEALDRILSQFLAELKSTNQKLIPFAQGLINSCQGGKRIRGVLVKLGYELSGGLSVTDIIKIGAAYEILHAGLLIHDDIVDRSLKRRDQPSLYQALGGNHYGISQAINIGDISLYLPIKIITESIFPAELNLKALNLLSKIILSTAWGQILDVAVFSKKEAASVEIKEFININKTAKYTIAGPLQIGAILGGANEKLVAKLGKFGELGGIAFQIKDDILDKEAGLLDTAEAKALEYAIEAKKVTSEITKDKKMRILLEGMIEYLIQRRK